MTPNDLKNYTSGDFDNVMSVLQTAAGDVGNAAGELTSVAGQLENWKGTASDAARTTVGDLGTFASPVATALSDAGSAITVFCSGIFDARNSLMQAASQATSIPAQVDWQTGTVTPDPVTHIIGPLDKAQQTAFNQEVQRRQNAANQAEAAIRGAVQTATSIDQAAAGQMQDGSTAGRSAGTVNLGAPGGTDLTKLNLGRLGEAPTWFSQNPYGSISDTPNDTDTIDGIWGEGAPFVDGPGSRGYLSQGTVTGPDGQQYPLTIPQQQGANGQTYNAGYGTNGQNLQETDGWVTTDVSNGHANPNGGYGFIGGLAAIFAATTTGAEASPNENSQLKNIQISPTGQASIAGQGPARPNAPTTGPIPKVTPPEHAYETPSAPENAVQGTDLGLTGLTDLTHAAGAVNAVLNPNQYQYQVKYQYNPTTGQKRAIMTEYQIEDTGGKLTLNQNYITGNPDGGVTRTPLSVVPTGH